LHHVTYFYNFGTPSISLEASNLVCGFSAMPVTQKIKLGQKGHGLRHVTYFYNFGTPSISLEQIKLETSSLVCGLNARPVTQKMQNCVKGGVAYVT